MASKIGRTFSSTAPMGPALRAAASQLGPKLPLPRSTGDKPAGNSLMRRASSDNNQAETTDQSPTIRPPKEGDKVRRSRSANSHPTKSGGDPYNLRRFTSEQSRVFSQALAEINDGRKRSHWMWYVIPTPPFIVNGVERGSPTNKLYSIRTQDEGLAFLNFTADNVNLGENYRAMLCAVEAQLKKGVDPVKLMGSLDAPKLRSSAAFFAEVAEGTDDKLTTVCQSVVRLLDG
jgi:uncharacterized protein (DUF1810 family)